MRKIVLFLAVLFMAVPVMAAVSNVTITCTQGTGADINQVTVRYATDVNYIRAFALDINTANANINSLEPNALANYRIYPGQIVIVDGNVTDYNTPYAPGDLRDKKVTVEMGSLYTMDSNYASDANAGYNKKPAKHGILLKFRVGGATCYKVDVNAFRGGIVMEDPYESPNISSPLFRGCVVLQNDFDFGDAPNSYKTQLADVPIGPSHLMAGLETGIGPRLGSLIDSEADGQPSANCTLDDTTNLDDEDGVVFGPFVVNESNSVTVTVSGAAGYLNAWVDWNKDGDFADAGEKVFNDRAVAIGPNPLNVSIPGGAYKNAPLVSRWRVTSYTLPDVNYYGPATDGEVEDYNKPTIVCHVPNCVNDVNATAQAKLIANGFTIGTITTAYNCTIPAGNVIITDPPYCTTGNCGAVNMTVSKGQPALPGAASGPSPTDLATCVSVDANLSWTAGTGATSHDVYFGTVNPPVTKVSSGQPSTTYNPPGSMANNTTYFWRIDELNACGGKTTGTVWRFTTILGAPASITVPATDADGKYTVTWTAPVGGGATSYQLESSAPASGTTIYPLWVQVYSGAALAYNEKVGGGTWSYRVKATNACGSSAWKNGSNTCTISPLECLKNTATEYTASWVPWRYPFCWCYKKQCKGDINGSSFGGKPVTSADATTFKNALNQTNAVLITVANGICADLNHTAFGGKRVTSADATIFKANLNIAEASVLCCDTAAPAGDCTLVAGDKYNFWTTP